MAGELTEQERVYVKKNLPVDMEVMELNKSLTGTVTQVSETPKEEAAAKTSSIYPFIIELKRANERYLLTNNRLALLYKCTGNATIRRDIKRFVIV